MSKEHIQFTERVKGIKKNKKVPNVHSLKAEYLMIFYLGNISILLAVRGA
ncbi:hypothetical protein AQPE_1694 [Aquipluma nitroreducens]|uniref:Uncharacterized protein n=1 Tax=Aquipluma nitroreducens TaxID=2010828 RepID=A0A5K7S7J3_9BACT|nr:hypothetical protein AQPE_1694 [Aquipluma nitroreducens]